ncbi:MAG: LamG-like jellyroll fold domain-containing protein, partial [Pseudomonadota bacterium]
MDDSFVFAVGQSGRTARYDGTSWTTVATPTGQQLRDVHAVSPTLAFAVGDNGTALRWNGSAWSALAVPTGQDLLGVWADAGNAAWAVGEDGTLLAFDGTAWSDQGGAAGVNTRDIEDAWGDASGFYAMNDRGVLYRFDRSTASWAPPETACEFGNGFEDLWGDGSGRLFLARRRNVYLYDGASCSLMTTTAAENLLGISGSATTGEVYAAGRDGAVMYFNGAAWEESQQGTVDLRDNWVSTAGNPYFVGQSGDLVACERARPSVIGDWHFDDCTLDLAGSTAADSSGNGLDGVVRGGVSQQTDGQLCPAVALDGTSGYVEIDDDPLLDVTQGLSFAVWVRHDGTPLGDWDAIFAKGDSSYRLHLNGGCEISDTLPGNTRRGITMGLNGGCAGADLNSNIVPAPGVWYHVAGTYDRRRMHLYINGALVNSADLTDAINTNNFDLFVGDNSQRRGRYWDGDIDELTLWDGAITAGEVIAHRDRTRPCTSCSAAAFVVNHDNAGIHCLDETIRVDVIDSLAGTPRIDYNAQVTLDTGSGRGTWTLLSGSGTLVDSGTDDGVATYDWPLGESAAEFALVYPTGPPSVNVDVFQTSDPLVRDQDGEGNLVYSASGFTVTGTPLPNPPPAVIAPFAGPRVAGTDM